MFPAYLCAGRFPGQTEPGEPPSPLSRSALPSLIGASAGKSPAQKSADNCANNAADSAAEDGAMVAVTVVQDCDLATFFPPPGPADHKYSRGVVALAAGTPKYPGAGALCTGGALGAGAGMVRLVARGPVRRLVLSHFPEAVAAPGRADAYVLGPGYDPAKPRHRAALADIWQRRCAAATPDLPLTVLDAGALDLVGAEIQPDAQTLLTPHAAEAAKLAQKLDLELPAHDGKTRPEKEPAGQGRTKSAHGQISSAQASVEQINANPAAWARLIARHLGCAVLIKGSITVACTPQGELFAAGPAPATLATAGSGDVLAGIIGALAAQNIAQNRHRSAQNNPPGQPLEPALLGALGAQLHAAAARYLDRPLRAGELGAALPHVWQTLRNNTPE